MYSVRESTQTLGIRGVIMIANIDSILNVNGRETELTGVDIE